MRCTHLAAPCSTRSSSTRPIAAGRGRAVRGDRDRRAAATAGPRHGHPRPRRPRQPLAIDAGLVDRRRRRALDDRRPSRARPIVTNGNRRHGRPSYGYWRDLEMRPARLRVGASAPVRRVGLIPTNDGETCVFAGGSPSRVGPGGVELMRDLLQEASPALAAARRGRHRHRAACGRSAVAPGSCVERGDPAGRSSATPATGRTR